MVNDLSQGCPVQSPTNLDDLRDRRPGSSGGVLVYDVTRRRTFLVLEEWLKELETAVGKKIPLVLVANKTDLPDRVVEPAEGKEFAKQHSMPYLESSAKTGEGIIDIFENLGRNLVAKRRQNH